MISYYTSYVWFHVIYVYDILLRYSDIIIPSYDVMYMKSYVSNYDIKCI